MVVPVHAISVYRRSRGTAPLILNLGTLPQERNPELIEQEKGELQSRSGNFVGENNMVSLPGLRTLDHPTSSLVAIQTTLPQLH